MTYAIRFPAQSSPYVTYEPCGPSCQRIELNGFTIGQLALVTALVGGIVWAARR